MEDSLRSVFFSYDLVQYVAKSFGYEWVSDKETLSFKTNAAVESLFDSNVGMAVSAILGQSGDLVYECYNEIYNQSEDPEKDFVIFAINATPAYFPQGYNSIRFLSFCAVLCGVATMFVEADEWGVADSAAEAISSVLTAFMLTQEFQKNGGFHELNQAAKHYIRCIAEQKRRK